MWPLGSYWWAVVLAMCLAILTYRRRDQLPFLRFSHGPDPFRRMTCIEVASLCARRRFRRTKAKDVDYWLGLLEASQSWSLYPISRHTELALGEWLLIVHGISRRNHIRFPRYFEKAMKVLDPMHLTNPTDAG